MMKDSCPRPAMNESRPASGVPTSLHICTRWLYKSLFTGRRSAGDFQHFPVCHGPLRSLQVPSGALAILLVHLTVPESHDRPAGSCDGLFRSGDGLLGHCDDLSGIVDSPTRKTLFHQGKGLTYLFIY